MRVSLDDRLQPFEACFNFRDLGGYEAAGGRRVTWGKLFRSDSLHRMTANDLERLVELGPPRVIDLRAQEEIADFGRLTPDLHEVRWVHRPIIESMILRQGERERPAGEESAAQQAGEGYFEFLGSGAMATSVLQLIAESDVPVVFHCTSGKDRTGVIAAMVLDLLGVPDETIAADYVLTRETRSRSMRWIAEHEPEFAAFLAEIPPERRAVAPERILGFLEQVRSEHGSVEALVRAQGMTDQALQRLRGKLLE